MLNKALHHGGHRGHRVFLCLVFSVSSVASVVNQTEKLPEIHILPVRGNVYMLVGAGANITASVGKDGVLVVDTGAAPMADRVIAVLNELSARVNSSSAPAKPCAGAGCTGLTAPTFLATIASPAPPKPISYIINTHLHGITRAATGKWPRPAESSAADLVSVELLRARTR